jgi:hypothetical protein
VGCKLGQVHQKRRERDETSSTPSLDHSTQQLLLRCCGCAHERRVEGCTLAHTRTRSTATHAGGRQLHGAPPRAGGCCGAAALQPLPTLCPPPLTPPTGPHLDGLVHVSHVFCLHVGVLLAAAHKLWEGRKQPFYAYPAHIHVLPRHKSCGRGTCEHRQAANSTRSRSRAICNHLLHTGLLSPPGRTFAALADYRGRQHHHLGCWGAAWPLRAQTGVRCCGVCVTRRRGAWPHWATEDVCGVCADVCLCYSCAQNSVHKRWRGAHSPQHTRCRP